MNPNHEYLEVVDLGDAKQMTTGPFSQFLEEDSPTALYGPEP